jgi:hypothetical protein
VDRQGSNSAQLHAERAARRRVSPCEPAGPAKPSRDADGLNHNGARGHAAGVTTGIDLALEIIRADYGNAPALTVARELVVQLRRTGGQSQYAMHLAGQFAKEGGLGRLVETVIADPSRAGTLAIWHPRLG